MDRIKVVSQDDEKTVLRVLVTPYGDAKNLDLDGEYFNAETDFGDGVVVPVKTAFYEHGVNTINNPHMKTTKQVLGQATFVEDDDWGRWYEFEIKRSLEYHDYLMNMVDMKIMGASTGCHLNMKVNGDPDAGEDPRWIKTWYEAEPSLTPTPAHPFTIGKNEEISSDTVAKVNSAIKSFKLDHLFDELTLESKSDDTSTSEEELEGSESNQGEDQLGIDEEIDAIFNEGEEPEVEDDADDSQEVNDDEAEVEEEDIDNPSLDDVAKAVVSRLQPTLEEVIAEQVKASFDIWINMWGYGDESDPRDAIANLLNVGKSYAEDNERLVKALRSVAKGIVKNSPKEMLHEVTKMSEAERLAFESLPDPTPKLKSNIPDDAPGS